MCCKKTELILKSKITFCPLTSTQSKNTTWLPSSTTAPSSSRPQNQLWGDQAHCCPWPTSVPSSHVRSASASQPPWRPSWTAPRPGSTVASFPRWSKRGRLLKQHLRWQSRQCPKLALSSPLALEWSKPALKCKRMSERVGSRKKTHWWAFEK